MITSTRTRGTRRAKSSTRILRAAVAGVAGIVAAPLAFFSPSSAEGATTLFWSGNGTVQGGAGQWTTTTAHWGPNAGPFTTVWNNANIDNAVFDTTAATVTLGATGITVGTITTSITGYTIGSGNVSGATNTITFSGAGAGIITTNSATLTTIAAVMNGTVTKGGNGRLELGNGSNPSTIKYILAGGSLTSASIARLSGSAPGALVSDFMTFNGGGWAINTGSQDTGLTRGITIKSGGAFFGSSSLTVNTTVSSPIVGTEGGDLTITGAGPFTGNSSSTAGDVLILTNPNNSWNGNVIINGPTSSRLIVGANNVIPDTAVVTLSAAGNSFDLTTFSATETVKSISGASGTINIGAGQLTVANPNGESFTSALTSTSAGKFIKNGAGALTLAPSNTGFVGEFQLNNGTIGVAGANAFGAGTLSINGGKISNTATTGRSIPVGVAVTLNNTLAEDDSLFNSGLPGNIQFLGPTTIAGANRTISVSGTVQIPTLILGTVGQDVAGRGIIKTGNAILSLASVNTYSGDTTILAGAINVNGTSTLGDATGTLNLSGGALQTTASRTASSAPIANPLNVTADSTITTTSTAATIDLNFNNNSIVGAAGTTLTIQNASGGGGFVPRLSGGGFAYNGNIAINSVGSGTTTLQSFNTGNDQTFNGVISGSGAYRRTASTSGTGGNTLFMTLNTFSGGVSLNDGGIGLGIDSVGSPVVTSGPLGTGTLTIAGTQGKLYAVGGARNVGNAIVFNSTPLGITGSNDLTLSGSISLGTANRTINVDNTGASVLSGVISGTVALTKGGTGTLTLAGPNANSGAVNINGGTVSISSTGNLGDSSVSNVLNFDNGTLKTTANLDNARAVTLNTNGGTISTDPSTSATFSGVIGGSGNLTKTNSGTLVLSNAGNTFSGATNINGGVLSIPTVGALGNTSAINITSATLKTATNMTLSAPVTLSGSGGIVDTDPNTTTFTGVVSGTAGLTKINDGTLVLTNTANSYSGGTFINGGTLATGDNEVLPNSGAVTVSGGTLDISTFNETVGNVTLSSGAILGSSGVLTGSSFGVQSGTVTAALAGAGALTKTTGGTVTLSSSSNSYSGGTNVNAGSLIAGADNAIGSGALSVAGGTLDIGASNQSVGNVTLSGGAILGTSGVLNGNSYGMQSGSVSAILGGTAAMTKTTAGTVTLTGANTFSGGTTVSGGTLALGATNTLPGNVTVAAGTLDIGTFNNTSANVALTGGSINGTTGTLSADNFDVQSGSASAILGGTAAMTKSTAGTVTLSGANTFSGGVNINAGTLVSGANGSLSSGNVTVSGGILDVGATNNTVATAALTSGSINGTSGTLSASAFDMQSGGVSAILGGTGAMTKSTGGTVTLTANNTYSGGTAINAGVLRVNNTTGSGTGSGNVAVNSTGTLAGSGIITGAVSVASGGHVAPGNSIGTITVGAITLDTGSVLEMELGAPSAADLIVVTTASTGLTLNGGAVNLTDAGGLDVGTYTLIDYDTAFAGSLANLSIGTSPSGFNYTLVNDVTATAIDLVVSELVFASSTWNVNASGNWSTASNWTPGIPSGVDAVANFGNIITADRTVTLNGARTVGTVNFDNANSYTLAGSTLTLQTSSGNAAINVITGNHTIAAPVAMGSDTTVDTATASSLSISGVVSGSNSLTKANGGTLVLSGTNTYTGATNINGGVVSVGANANLGDPGNALNFAGGTLATTGSFDSARAVTLAGSGGTVDAGSGVTTSFSGVVAGTGDLTKTNSGTLALTNSANSYSGATNINGGVLAATVAGALGNTSAISINGATLKTAADMSIPAPVTLGGSGGVVDTDPSNVTFAGVVAGVGSLTKINAGSLTLSNSGNSYSGGTNVNGGSLISAADNALGTGNVAVNAATLDIGATNNTVGQVSLFANGNINGTTGVLTGTGYSVQSGSISAILAGTGALAKIGPGIVNLSGANTYSGGTNIAIGTLAAAANNTLPAGGAVAVNGGVLDLDAFNQTVGPVTLSSGTIASTTGVLTADSYAVQSGNLSAIIAGTGAVTKTTGGTVTMGNSANTYSGGTNVNAGSLVIGGNNAMGTGNVSVAGGTLDVGASNNSVGAVTLSSGSINGSTGVLTGTSYGVQSGSISATLAGTAALTKSTGGTVTLSSSSNSYGGGTSVNAGTLVSGADNSIGTGAVSVAGGTLDVGTSNNTVGAVTLSSGSINGTTGVLTGSSYGVQDGSISAILGGAGALTKTTAGTVTISGANTYSGGTNVNGGVLVAGANNALPTGGAVNVNGGALDIGATSHSAGAVTLVTGNILGTTGTLSGDSFDLQSGSISASLGGTGAVTKSTGGTVVLSGNSTYSGGTAVSAGTLRVNNTTGSGTGSGDVNVASGAFLAGTGSIAGNVILASGAHLEPGNSIGTITVGGLTLNTGSILGIELGAPVSSDQVIVTTPSTGLTLNGGTVDLTNTGGLAAGTYVLIDYDTAFVGSLSNLSLGIQPSGFAYDLVNDGVGTAIDLVVSNLAAGETAWAVDASGNWSPTGNWTNGRPDSADVTATFGSVITAARTVTVDGTRTVGTLKFDNANSYTLAGSAITLQTTSGNAGINVLSGSHTIASNVAMANDTVVDTASGTSVSITGVLSGSSSLTKISDGTLVLGNGGNTYSGATNLSGGVLQLNAAGALGNTSALNITSATLKTAADMNISAPVTLSGTGATVDTDPSNVTFSGTVTGTGGLTKINAGSLTLSNSGNTYSGGTTVNGGSLISAANNALGTGNVTVNAATLDVGASNNTVGTVTLTSGTIAGTTGVLNGTAFNVQAGSISAILGGGGALTKTTGGTVTLAGANTYSGGTNVNAGTLALGANNALPATGAVGIDNGAALDIGTSSTSAGPVTLVNGSIIGTSGVLSGSSYNVQSGSVSANLGGGPLAKTTAGTVTLSGSNTYTGGTSINGGTLSVAADNNLGAAAGNLSFGGGTLSITGSFASTRNISIAAATTGTITNTGSNSFSGTVTSNNGNLTKAGVGSLALSGVVTGSNGYNVTGGTLALTNTSNTVTGPVSVTGGSTLSIAGSGAAGGSTGDVTLDGGTLSNTDTVNNNNFIPAARAINIGASGGAINVPAAAGTALVYGTGGSILGPGNTVTKTGTGTFRYSSPTSSTFSKLVVNGGLWQGNSDASFGAVPGSAVADQITLNGGGISANAAMQLNTNRGITLGPAGGTIDATTNLTYNGVIAGGVTGALNLTGANNGTSFTIGGANTYGGGTTIAVNSNGTGIITIAADTAFGTGKVTTVITGTGSPIFTSAAGARARSPTPSTSTAASS